MALSTVSDLHCTFFVIFLLEGIHFLKGKLCNNNFKQTYPIGQNLLKYNLTFPTRPKKPPFRHYIYRIFLPSLYDGVGCLWLGLLLTLTVLLGIGIFDDWKTLRKGPLKVIVEDPRIELLKIDFPAVTICPNIKVRKSKLDRLIDRKFGSSVNNSLLKSFKSSVVALSLLGYLSYNKPQLYLKHINTTPYILKNDDIRDIFHEVGPSIDEMIEKCFWRGNKYDCSDLFRRQNTESGYCYSFNSKSAIRNSNSSAITPPFMNDDGTLTGMRLNSAGKITGLELFFQKPEDEVVSLDVTGYSVMVHHPSDYPPVVHIFQVRKGKDKVIRFEVTVEKTEADISLKGLDEDARGCQLDMTTYKTTEENCYIQCRLEHIYKICNCTPYFFTEFKVGATVCGIQHLICLDRINMQLKGLKVTEDVPGFPKWSTPPTISCNCVPSCTEMSYTNKVRVDKRENSILEVKYAYLDIFYKQQYAIGYTRQAKLTSQEFLVGIGGMGGLYLGCSLISIMEIVYIVFQIIISQKLFSKSCAVKKRKKKTIRVFPYVN